MKEQGWHTEQKTEDNTNAERSLDHKDRFRAERQKIGWEMPLDKKGNIIFMHQ